MGNHNESLAHALGATSDRMSLLTGAALFVYFVACASLSYYAFGVWRTIDLLLALAGIAVVVVVVFGALMVWTGNKSTANALKLMQHSPDQGPAVAS